MNLYTADADGQLDNAISQRWQWMQIIHKTQTTHPNDERHSQDDHQRPFSLHRTFSSSPPFQHQPTTTANSIQNNEMYVNAALHSHQSCGNTAGIVSVLGVLAATDINAKALDVTPAQNDLVRTDYNLQSWQCLAGEDLLNIQSTTRNCTPKLLLHPLRPHHRLPSVK